jgi:predicted nuclease of restriction endonuclease-like (RecB) superfamily
MSKSVLITDEFSDIIELMIDRIKQAQYNALKSFSTEKVNLAWDLGSIISNKVKENNWGTKVVSNLADELQLNFPGITGFNARDLAYMKQFYETYASDSIMPPLVAQISWSNNRVILDKIKDTKEAEFYIKKCINNGWSKYDLIDKINSKTYQNSLLSQNNFNKTLDISIDLKRRVAWDFRDDYGIELINGEDPFGEKLLEDSIMHNLNKFLLAMDGKFSFVGRQIKLKVGDDEFFIDLLFYHLELNCYVVFELKATKFKAEHLGQIQGYLAIIDNIKKKPNMNPTIGILVCKDKNRLLVDYLLNRTNDPIGIATINHMKYQDLTQDLKELLPSDEVITNRLENLILDDELGKK